MVLLLLKNIIWVIGVKRQTPTEFSFSNEAGGKWPFAGGDNLGTQCSS